MLTKDVNRDHFLEKDWQRYPGRPVGHSPRSWDYGRLIAWGETELQLARADGVHSFQWNSQTRVGGVRRAVGIDDFRSVVRVGDWLAVAIDPVILEVILLAPALVEPRLSNVSPLVLQEWNVFRARVADFFDQRGFLSVNTPTLVVCPGTEPHLDPFATILQVGQRKDVRFLPTSPELSLKKLLAQGYSRVFEIRNCFRNGEISERHQPEFWMLEWYRAFASLDEIRIDVMDLLRHLNSGSSLRFHTRSVADLFREFFAFELTPKTSRDALVELCQKRNVTVAADDSWDDVFFRLFVEFIEPHLNSDEPLFVEKYPPSQAALARLTEDGWGDRFELYWKGFEIANAYHELNDPAVQRARTEQDVSERKRLAKSAVSVDTEFFRALDSGLPPSGGIALGLERLFLAQTDRKALTELRLFHE